MTTEPEQRDLVRDAKGIVALAFRNGPIEDLHAGKPCPACEGRTGYSRISDAEMKVIMKNAVNHVYKLLRLNGWTDWRLESQASKPGHTRGNR
jgi:hypothetical protein